MLQGAGADAVLPPAPLPAVLCASSWGEGDGLLRLVGRKLREPLAAPVPALFWAAGLSFSRAQLLLEAPYPSDLPGLFFGEESLQLMRMWRRGWDVFTPHLPVVYHQWSRAGRPSYLQSEQQPAEEQQQQLKEQQQRPAAQRRRSQQRVAAALAGQGDAGGGEGGGAPPVRSLQQFWEWTGVDFRSRAISERARCGGLPAGAFSLPLASLE